MNKTSISYSHLCKNFIDFEKIKVDLIPLGQQQYCHNRNNDFNVTYT